MKKSVWMNANKRLIYKYSIKKNGYSTKKNDTSSYKGDHRIPAEARP